MTEPTPRPQFIAGAVCPSCHEMDRIVVVGNADGGERRCVACGYSDASLPGAGTLPGTRFSRPPGAGGGAPAAGPTGVDPVDADKVTAVKIIQPLSKKP